MCGIVGCAGKIGNNEECMFKRMLEFDTVRGPHSTGALFVNAQGHTDVVKRVGTPWDWYQCKAVEEKFRTFSCVLMGHNRWATQGKINNVNAHPFEFDRIIGAHNGTLTTRYMLDDSGKFDVDSENLYHHMNRNGWEDTLPKLNGAFALTWWDKEERSLNFARNNQRPLYFTHSEDGRTFFWASEPWMISVAAHHSEVKIQAIKELPILSHMRVDVPLKVLASAEVIPEPTFTSFEGYQVPVYHRPANTGNVAPFPKHDKPALVADKRVTPLPVKTHESDGTPVIDSSKIDRPKVVAGNASFMDYQKRLNKEVTFTVWGMAKSANQKYIQCYALDDDRISVRCYAGEGTHLWKKLLGSTLCFKGLVKGFNNVGGMHLTVDLRSVDEDANALIFEDDDVPPLVFGYKDKLLTHEEFEKATERGCAWCRVHVAVEDAHECVFISERDFICPDCAEFETVQEFIKDAEAK